ncbi:hypothetical protein CCACVL1_28758, partial [Corchorus capsularis]
ASILNKTSVALALWSYITVDVETVIGLSSRRRILLYPHLLSFFPFPLFKPDSNPLQAVSTAAQLKALQISSELRSKAKSLKDFFYLHKSSYSKLSLQTLNSTINLRIPPLIPTGLIEEHSEDMVGYLIFIRPYLMDDIKVSRDVIFIDQERRPEPNEDVWESCYDNAFKS